MFTMIDHTSNTGGMDRIIPTADVRAARIATEAVQYESSIFCVEFTIEHTDQRSHLLRNIGNDRDLIEEVQPDGTIIICTLLEWHGFSGGSEGTHKFRSPVTGELFDVEDELLTDIDHILKAIDDMEAMEEASQASPRFRLIQGDAS